MAWGVLALALVFVVSSRVQSFECPKLSVQSLIPDPDDCRKYYHCLPDGRLFPMQCPNDLVFDSRQKVCIWDSTARSCAPDHELEPIKPWQPKTPATKTKGGKSDASKGRNFHGSRRNKFSSKQKKTSSPNRNRNRNRNEKRKPVTPKRPRHDWNRRTTRKRVVRTTTTTTRKPTTTTTATTTTTTTTTAMPPQTSTMMKEANGFGSTESPVQENGNLIGNILATLGFGMDSNTGKNKALETTEEAAPETDQFYDVMPSGERTVPSQNVDEKTEQTSERRGQQPHSVHKRSPKDNLIWDDVQCPSGYAYMPDPSSCDTFYHCYNWQPMKKVCPSGLFFDEQTYVCNWPHNVNCIEGYRAKSLFKFNEMRKTYKTQTRDSIKNSKSHKKTTKKPRRRPAFKRTTRPTPATSTKRSTTTTTTTTPPKPTTTMRTTIRTRTSIVRGSPTTSRFSRFPQKSRDNRISLKYSDGFAVSAPADDNTEDLKSQTTPSTSSSATLSLSPSTSKVPPKMTEKDSNEEVFNPQRQSKDNTKISDLETQPMPPNQKLTSSLQSSFQEDTAGPKTQSTGLAYDLTPSEKDTSKARPDFNGLPVYKPTPTDLIGSTQWHTATFFTSGLSHDNIIALEPYSGVVKRNNSRQEKGKKDSIVTATTDTVHHTTTASNNGTSRQDTQLVTQTTKISFNSQSSTNKPPKISSIPTAVNLHKNVNVKDTKIMPKVDNTNDTTTANRSQNPLLSSESQSPSEKTSARNKNRTSSLPPSSTTDKIATTSKASPTTSTATTKTTSRSAVQTKMITKTAIDNKMSATTPIAFTAAKIPFYAMRNLRVQPVTWSNQGRLHMPAGYRRGNRLRARTHNAQGRSMKAYSFSRPSMAASTFRTTPSLKVNNKPVLARHPDSPEDVQIEKFMINLLNNAMRTKHVVSRDTSRNRGNEKKASENVTIIYGKTPSQNTDDGTINSEDIEVAMGTQPLLFFEVDTKEDFTTTKDVEDMRVSGKVITDMTASVSTPADVIKQNSLKPEGEIINDPSSLSFSADRLMEGDSDNLIAMEHGETLDKHLLKHHGKGEKDSIKMSHLSEDTNLNDELDYSGDIDSEWSIPKIQTFSALHGQELSKEQLKTGSSSESDTALTKGQNHSQEENARLPVAGDNIVFKNSEQERNESENTTEELNGKTTTLVPPKTVNLTHEAVEKPKQTSSAGMNSTELLTAANTTVTANQQPSDCNATNCTSLQTKENLKNSTLNTTKLSAETTSNSSNITVATKTASTTTLSDTTKTEASTPKPELYVAKDLPDDNNDNRIDVQMSDDTVNTPAESDLQENDEMINELDGVEPKHKKENIQNVQQVNVSEIDTSMDLKSDNGLSSVETPDNPQASPETPTAVPILSNNTVEEKDSNASSHKPDSFLNITNTHDTFVSPSHINEKDAGQQSEGRDETSESTSSENSTTVSHSSYQTKHAAGADDTDSIISLTGSAARTEDQLQNLTSRVDPDFNIVVATKNSETSNSTTSDMKNKTLTVVTKEDTKSSNTTESAVVILVESENEPNITLPKTKNITNSLNVSLVEITSLQDTTITESTTQEIKPDTTNANNISDDTTTLETANDTSVDIIKESEQIPVLYLSDNTDVDLQNMMNRDDESSSEYDDVKKSDMDEGSLTLATNTEKSNTINTTSSNRSTESQNHSKSTTTTSTVSLDNSTTSLNTSETTLTFTESTHDVSVIVTNMTMVNETIPSRNSSSRQSQVARLNSSDNTTNDYNPAETVSTTIESLELELENAESNEPSPQSVVTDGNTKLLTSTAIYKDKTFNEESSEVKALVQASSVDALNEKNANNTLMNLDENKQSSNNDQEKGKNNTDREITAVSGNTKRSFVSLTDLITWYLKHWRNYSKWRQEQTTPSTTVTF